MMMLITLDKEDIKKILKGQTVEIDLDPYRDYTGLCGVNISTYMNIPMKNTILVKED